MKEDLAVLKAFGTLESIHVVIGSFSPFLLANILTRIV